MPWDSYPRPRWRPALTGRIRNSPAPKVSAPKVFVALVLRTQRRIFYIERWKELQSPLGDAIPGHWS